MSQRFEDLVPKRFRKSVRRELAVGREKRAEAEQSRAEIVRRQGDAPADVVAALRAIDEDRARASTRPRKSSLRKRQERGDALRRRRERKSEEQRERFAQKMREWGHPNPDPPEIPRRLHAITAPMLADAAGNKARDFTLSLPRVISRRLQKAALEPEPYQGSRPRKGKQAPLRTPHQRVLHGPARYWERAGRRRWSHPAAIKTVAAFAVLWMMSTRTRMPGCAAVTRGMGRGLVCSILKTPGTNVPASLSACFGNMDGVPGYVRALERAGLFYSQQPPAGRLPARDVGPKGWAFKVYRWFPWLTKQLPKNATPEVREELSRAERTPRELGRAPPAD